MTATKRTSLSAPGPAPEGARPNTIRDYKELRHPPHVDRLDFFVPNHARIQPVSIDVDDAPDGASQGFLHLPPDLVSLVPADHHRAAAILVSGAGGGVSGPGSVYLSMGCKLATPGAGIPVLRLEHRYPARNRYCAGDVRAAMDWLGDAYGLTRFVLVGWSFGAAPVFTVAEEDERVVGCAAVAGQTAETEGIRGLAPRPVLLVHGKEDNTLSYSCSERLYEKYGSKGSRELRLFEGGNHALMGHAAEVEELLCDFVDRCATYHFDDTGKANVLERDLVDGAEREDLMRKGGDLRGPEHME